MTDAYRLRRLVRFIRLHRINPHIRGVMDVDEFLKTIDFTDLEHRIAMRDLKRAVKLMFVIIKGIFK